MTESDSRLKKIYERFGEDRSRWGWRVVAQFKCRARRGNGLLISQIVADIQNQVSQCPFEQYEEEIVTPHPADNIAGVIAATDFPTACKLCKMKPEWHDFDIK